MNFKYCLIISQFYHSYLMLPVAIKDNFIEQAKKFTAELNAYKGSLHETLGDLKCADENLDSRYNVNADGDIYFINFNSIYGMLETAKEYEKVRIIARKGYKANYVMKDIAEHHNYADVITLVEKYFEII